MKKYIFLLLAAMLCVFSSYADTRDTCPIQGANGASVVAEAAGKGHNEVYINFYNDSSSYVNLTVYVTVENQSGYTASGSKTFLVKPGRDTGTVKITGVSWAKDNFSITEVSVSGARCSK